MGNSYSGITPDTTAGATPATNAGALSPIKIVSVGLCGSAFALLCCLYFSISVFREKLDTKVLIKQRLDSLSRIIRNAAQSYLFEQYKWLCVWVACLSIIIACILRRDDNKLAGLYTMISYIVGSVLSAAAGFLGMYTATSANARTAQACERNIAEGLQVAFGSGAVMGNGVTGLALGGLWVLYMIWFSTNENSGVNAYKFDMSWGYLAGFGFGASSIGMFARVGGGVFTKAADVGADLVGKVEQGIPEDDARNPAVIADNVGDNVGDVAGMGADLFESYAGALIASATLAPELAVVAADYTSMSFTDLLAAGSALPFWLYGFGTVTSFIGIALVRNFPLDNEKTTLATLLRLINWGVYLASFLSIGTTICACVVLFDSPLSWRLVGATLIGLVAGIVIANFTEYCTSYEDAPTRGISSASEFGPAPVIIKGLGVGMMSVSVPVIAIVITILACNALVGLYGVSIAAVGMLCTLPITLATDAYGPVADNAGGLAEMAGMPPEIRSRTDRLDSLGNTTAATGKGLAIGSALLTAIGLISAFLVQSGAQDVQLNNAITLAGILIGCGLPFVFGALTMLSVDRGARSIIVEVRRQFATCPDLLELPAERAHEQVKGLDGKMYPDANRCVQIATEAAIQEMVLPGILAVFVPVGVGYLLGPFGLGGLLAGSLGTCFCLALTMANAGGAWDNSKKWCEKCASEGEPTGNGDEVHYTFFGVKSARVFDAAVAARAHLAPADKWRPFLRAGAVAPVTEAEVVALRESLEELYHMRHSGTVTGDTVGDPFKDTSGPALNVLSKTQTMVALMLAPSYKSMSSIDGGVIGFGKMGTVTAAVILVVVGTLLFIAVSYFNHLRQKRDAEATELKKKAEVMRADRDRTRAAAGATAHDVNVTMNPQVARESPSASTALLGGHLATPSGGADVHPSV